MLGAFNPAKSSADTYANKRESAKENMPKVGIQMLFKWKLIYFVALELVNERESDHQRNVGY